MRRTFLGVLATAAALWPALVSSYASTDSIMDADLAQSGYLPNHNMDPNVVGSTSFGILWQQAMPNSVETWYAKPLTYTLNGGSEMVITASNMNNVRIHDAKNGTLIASRQLLPPFLQSDIGCADIPNYIGITGTPIIDPATDIMYLFAKGYKGEAASGGLANGIYRMYALQLPTLTDVSGFPVLIDGHNADNDHTRYFVGGTVLQRPSLTTLNGVVVGAFGGHCDLFNYTGYVVAVSKTPGVGVVSLFATEISPGAPSPQTLDITVQGGGKAGIWQSGMGLATDGSRIFVVTGNGQGHANGNVPSSGRLPLTTLDECVVNLAVSAAGKITLTDYFEPYDYVNMDAGDRDLGSSGTCLLDGSTFKTSSVSRIAVTVGKNSKVYITNADNLGGFKQGSGGTDGILQTITVSNSVFGGAGSYPLEGGFFYFTPVGDYTYAYKFGTDSSGAPYFVQAGRTPTTSAGRAGVGQPTVTTNNGQAGTAILWITDVNTGLGAYRAVPDANGILQPISIPATPGSNKYQRPAFGNGRVFVTAANKIIALGAPVNSPLTCTSPVDFGNVQTGSTGSATVSCTANIGITQVNGCTTVDPKFQCSNSTMPPGAVAAGSTFTFPVVWNLTQKAIENVKNTSYGTVIPGIEGTVLNVFTTNSVAGYTTSVPVSLTGTVVSKDPFLFISPGQVSFGGLVLGSADAPNGLSGSATIQNIGNSTMTILGMAWQSGNSTGAYNNVTFSGSNATFGEGFSATDFPAPGSTMAAGVMMSLPLFFNTSTAGSYSISLTVWSDGGVDSILFSASAGNPPIASIAVSTLEGGWDNSVPVTMAFGNVLAGTTVTRQIRICNSGGSVLTITKSKPPVSAQLTATNPYGDLLEGQKIDVGACAYGTVAVYAGTVQPNHPAQYIDLVWVLNTDGMDALNVTQAFGVHDVDTSVTIVSKQVGPLLANGTARYQWTGCMQDSNGRNLATQINNAAQLQNNTNEQCQTLCFNAGYTFAGTEYRQECWCGNTINYPKSYTNDSLNYCTFSCTGDSTESCGGNGGYLSLYADITKFDIQAFYASLNAASSTSSSATPTPTSSTASSSSVSGSASASSVSTSSASASSASASASSTSASASASASSSSTSSSSSSAAPSASSSVSPLNPNMPQTVSNQWNYVGCYLDNVNGVRSLSSASTAASTMTLEACASFCSAYNYFGTEYGRECYCGYTLNTTTLKANEGDCNTPCMGNSAELCGTGNRLSVYDNQVYQAPPPQPSHVAQSGNYAWIGCYSEGTNSRALSMASYANNTMTVDVCAAFCASKSTTMMGVEYGRECYCGNSLAAGSVILATSSCNMLCAANPLQYCGAGSKLDLYTYSPAPTSTSSSAASSSTSSSISSSIASSTSSSLVVTSSSSSGVPSVGDSFSPSASSGSGSSALASSSSSSSSSAALASSTSSSSSPSSTQSASSSSAPSSAASSASSSTSSSSSVPPASSSSSSSSAVTSSSSSSIASVSATTTSSSYSSSTSTSSTSTGPTPTATNGYYLIGCFSDVSNAHALPQILANNSVTPELCINYANSVYSAALSQPTPPARLPYLFLEYHHECYGGSSFDFMGSAVTSLIGTRACTDYCYGSVLTSTGTDGIATTTTKTDNMCGGAKQFNLYALQTTVSFPTTGGPVTTVVAP